MRRWIMRIWCQMQLLARGSPGREHVMQVALCRKLRCLLLRCRLPNRQAPLCHASSADK